jgi:hypothetical protein
MRLFISAVVLLSATTAFAVEHQLPIPSDPKATYFVLEKGGTKNNPTLMTKRVGPSGTSYSQRLFDCNAGTVKYLSTGDTTEDMKNSKPDPKMAPLVEGSIAWYQ